MSIDLGRPQVSSMGQHDPLDGLLTFQELQAGREDIDLRAEIGALAKLCTDRSWETDDPLGIGGLLCDALRLTRLLGAGTGRSPDLLSELLLASIHGLDSFLRQRSLERSAASRLAFREFGLSIGLHAVGRLRASLGGLSIAGTGDVSELVKILERHEDLAVAIERFWRAPESRKGASWRDHRDINEVMFSTSLAPAGFLGGGS
jgi:hypothetical protein